MNFINNIWEIYENIEIIGSGSFDNVYKAKNKQTNEYVAIKEIKKIKINSEKIKKEFEIMKQIKSENIVNLKEIFETKESYWIILELCYLNLEDYMKKRIEPLSIEEIKEILLDLNKGLKEINDNKIIHTSIKPSNILLSINKSKINKTSFKISELALSKLLKEKKLENENYYKISETISPEYIKGELITSKSDIWSLGIVIYYMLYKKYPFNGTEYDIIKQIELKNKFEIKDDKNLNDLLNKMLIPNANIRISWEQYFQHPFFKFNSFKCNLHLKNYYSYCSTCQYNICEKCLNNHSSHKIIYFNQIKLNTDEISKINYLFRTIEIKFDIIKTELKEYFDKMKSNDPNIEQFDDYFMNYKEYYINYLEIINKQLDINKIQLIDLYPNLTNNYIICEYDIISDKNNEIDFINEPIRIINSYEEALKDDSLIKGKNNEEQIKENCELYLNNNKLKFSYKYKFPKEGKYTIKILIKKYLNSINNLFFLCDKLISIDLSHFNTNNVTDMSYMFYSCSSLKSLNLSNFNTNNVRNMSFFFHQLKKNCEIIANDKKILDLIKNIFNLILI